MKRIFLLIAIILFTAAPSFGEVVTLEQAKAKAMGHFKERRLSPALNMVWDGGNLTKAVSNDPAFYVFNNQKGGFVIVAGDDCVEPILGYSDNGKFVTENMPSNVAAWFAEVEAYIELGRAMGFGQYSSAAASDSSSAEVMLETPLWDQTSPFNAKCPEYNGARTVTGCVATAMAELLWTIRYPAAGKGYVQGYTTETNGIVVDKHELGSYNWDLMPKDGHKNWSSEEINEVAQLMYDCGTMVKADYGLNSVSGTSAYSEDVVPALIKHMGIDSSATYVKCGWYTNAEWTLKLRKEIDRGYPVFYAGRTVNNEGHAFIIDGYDSDGKFHINFGWGGTNNAFYVFPDFGQGAKYCFSESHSAIFGVKPYEGGPSGSNLLFTPYDKDDHGLSSSTAVFLPGVEFEVTVDGIVGNPYDDYFSGELTFARIDSENNFQEIVSEPMNIEIPGGRAGTLYDCFCTCSEIGVADKVIIVCRRSGQEEWIPVHAVKDNPNFVYELPLVTKLNPEILAYKSSFDFDKESGIITLTSLAGTECVLKDASGKDISDRLKITDNVFKIDTTDMEGTYSVTLSNIGVSFSFTFEI